MKKKFGPPQSTSIVETLICCNQIFNKQKLNVHKDFFFKV